MGSWASDRRRWLPRFPLWLAFLLPALAAAPALAITQLPKNPWKVTSVALADGSAIELREDAVARTRGGEVLWTVPAKEPGLPLLFTDSKGTPLFLFYDKIEQNRAAFKAVELEKGRVSWTHDFWGNGMLTGAPPGYAPVTPVFYRDRIYYGRALWLDALEPDSGVTVERHWAGDRIASIEPQPDGSLNLQLELWQDVKWGPLAFRQGKIENALRAPSDMAQLLRLMRFAVQVDSAFFGTGRPTDFAGYLDLHKFKTRKPSEAFVKKFAAFDLRATEGKYREAYRQDPLNPYLPLYLAFCLKVQGRGEKAKALYEEALAKSLVSWHEPLWMGSDCEKLGLTRWADELYEKGIRAYFETEPAPPPEVFNFLDVVLNFQAQRVSSAIFYNGHVERALHLLDTRRRMFPFCEADEIFSNYYANWLKASGKSTEAAREEARIESAPSSRSSWFPWWAQGWFGLYVAAWVLAAVLLARILGAFRQILSLLLFILISLVLVPNFMPLAYFSADSADRFPFLTLLFAAILGFFTWMTARVRLWWIRRKTPPSGGAETAATRKALLVLLSHSLFLYASAIVVSISLVAILSGRGWAGHCAGLACLPLLWLFRRWGRRQPEAAEVLPEPPPKDRRVPAFALTLLFAWVITTWYLYHLALYGCYMTIPMPTFDLGQPVWSRWIENNLQKAISPSRDLLFASGLSAQLGGFPEKAKASYLQAKLLKDPRALNNLGVLALPGDPKAAAAYFRRALERDPGCAPALYNLGLLAGDNSLIEKARRIDEWGVELHRKYCPGRPMIAQVPVAALARSGVWSWEAVGLMVNPLSVTRFVQPTQVVR